MLEAIIIIDCRYPSGIIPNDPVKASIVHVPAASISKYPGNLVTSWYPGPSVSRENKMAVNLGGNFGYVFSVEEANQLIEDLEIQSTAKFACFKATKDFGSVGEWDSYNKLASLSSAALVK